MPDQDKISDPGTRLTQATTNANISIIAVDLLQEIPKNTKSVGQSATEIAQLFANYIDRSAIFEALEPFNVLPNRDRIISLTNSNGGTDNYVFAVDDIEFTDEFTATIKPVAEFEQALYTRNAADINMPSQEDYPALIIMGLKNARYLLAMPESSENQKLVTTC